MKTMELIRRTIDTHVTPLAYLFATWQFVFGINHLFEDVKGGAATVLSQIDPLIPSELWGLFLSLSALLLVIGMLVRNIQMVSISAFSGFVLWIMATLSYALNGFIWLHVPTSLLIALMFGYFFLAAGLDQLWDYSPEG